MGGGDSICPKFIYPSRGYARPRWLSIDRGNPERLLDHKCNVYTDVRYSGPHRVGTSPMNLGRTGIGCDLC